MPKTSFSNDERTAAKANHAVLFHFAVDGGGCGDFPYQDFARGGLLRPDHAEDLVDTIQAMLRKFRAEILA